jgi:UDP-glucose 4-epimerase
VAEGRMKMKIVVTGGAGFIGSHLVDRYIEKGHCVTVLDDLSTGCKEWIHPKAEFIPIKLTDPNLRDLIYTLKPDLINHHAAHVDVRKSVENPLLDLETNLLGTIHLLEAAGYSGVKKVIFASSGGAIYGECKGGGLAEASSGKPLSPYGINKLSAEFYIDFYSRKYGFQWIILRYSNVYGPRQGFRGEAGVISVFIDRLKKGLALIVFGNGEQIRDYIHVQDVVEANLLFSQIDGKSHDIYNVSTGVGTSLNELIKILSPLLPSSESPVYIEAKPGDIYSSILSVEKLKSLGWIPKVPLIEGLTQLAGPASLEDVH